MNIPTIEELDRIGASASCLPKGILQGTSMYNYVTAIRDAVVAACRPQLRLIAEMPAEVPEGCVRRFACHADWSFTRRREIYSTHYIDIAIPSPSYPANFEQAFAESKLDAKDKAAAFKLWKGGTR